MKHPFAPDENVLLIILKVRCHGRQVIPHLFLEIARRKSQRQHLTESLMRIACRLKRKQLYIYRYKHTHIYIYVYIFRVFLGFSPFIQLLLRWNSKHQLVPAPRSLDRSPWRSRTHLAWRSRWIDGNPPKTTQDTQLWGY